ncbi:MAG: hypothetical protein ACP6IS_10455, partial [Candidatus Asgardarchaeia archaeon]
MQHSDVDFEYSIIRDPIYGYIGLSERELRIVDTIAFQRLRRIKQLAMTDIVYPYPDLTVITFKIFANDTFGNEAYSKEYSYTVVD